ncbi:PREDICTED: vacuolar protein-sorting-associated protein 33 homolog isoform X2 [Tarenaya hassleriana]|uniref:vacuolar protein-sorting-associated protein 33 homolog isoform X2 n=1 Tax=Tarenaya hassleriana TaxID=28532 RepID=UPI00053C76FD|nr:PREDICTED: vacuolar protein-sorting-associated protein 33 homolog isoform X2 [Tarenaya hassleriana]
MAQIPNLDNSPLNLKSLREKSQRDLINSLKDIRGNKCLVIDPKLSGSLSLIIQTSLLKEHGVELRHLSAEPLLTECTKVVYLVRSQLSFMKSISLHIQNDTSKAIQREYYVYFVPRRSVACEKILEQEKVHNLVTVREFPLYMVPLDEDVISFELELAEKEYLVDGDPSSLWHVAKAIHELEFSFGVIPKVRAKGKASVRVADILNRMQVEESVSSSDVGRPEIDTLILLDREVDMVTPMLSQLTYEGLLDEFLHISNGAVEVDSSVMGVQQEGKKMKVPLNSSDKLFKETRDLNFEVVVQVLRQKATSMKQDYSEISTTQTVSELKDFVKKLNSLPEMTRHINLAQHLTTFTSKQSFLSQLDMEHTFVESQTYDICFEYIEEMIHKQEPLTSVLRLLVLFSVTNSGLPKKHFDYLRRELLHSYGFEHIVTLNNLEKAGLFKKQEFKSNWQTVKRSLQLVVEDTDTANPNDISYVFSGYAPLSIRLVQQAIRSGWRPVEEILKLLPGPHLETKRSGIPSSPSVDSLHGASNGVADGRRSLVLVVFIGGVTFAEIAALRYLSSQEGMAYDLIVATTKIVNGSTLIETFMEKVG